MPENSSVLVSPHLRLKRVHERKHINEHLGPHHMLL